MGLLNGSKKEIIAIEKMRPVKKSKNAHLQSVYSRLSTGRDRFEQVVMDTLSSTMGMSSLDLMLEHGKKMLQESSDKLSTSTTNILDIVKETADIGSEASAQHEEMTSALEEAVHESDSVMNTLEESSEELEVILSQSKETITNSREMQNDMSDLSEIIGHMNEVIGSITAISAQTNLLALNASIEAARAGEAGKGFAVVAEQIRQLADETKTLTDSMGSFVANIKTASEKSVESVDNTVDSLEKMSEGIQSIWEHNTENKQSVGKITGYMKTFSDLSEEICQSFAVVEERLNTVATECEIIHAQSEELEGVNQSLTSMMAPVKNIEESLDATTKQMGDMSQDPFYMLDNSAFVACVKNAVTAHESWLHKLEDMVETGEITPLQTDPTKCGFGHFYYSVNPKNAQIVPIWEGLEDKHRRFHGYAVEIIEQLGKGADVQGTLEEATKLAGELQNDFEQIIEITEDLEKKQIRVLEG